MTAVLTGVENPPGGARSALQWVAVTLQDRTARVAAIAGGRIAVHLQDWASAGGALSRVASAQRARPVEEHYSQGRGEGSAAVAAFPPLRVAAKLVVASAALPPPPTTQSSDGPFNDPARGAGADGLTNDMFTQGAANDMFTQVETQPESQLTQEAEPAEHGSGAEGVNVEQTLLFLTHLAVCA